MKPFIPSLICMLASLTIPPAHASDSSQHLVQSCKELVGIYAKREQMRLAAGLTTSVSEALRAGYCMGVVDEYRRSNSCTSPDWFEQARRIALTPATASEQATISDLLGKSCGA